MIFFPFLEPKKPKYGKSLQPSRDDDEMQVQAAGFISKLSNVQVVEDMVISVDPKTHEGIHPEMMTQGIVPQQELRTLNCQPSSDDTNKIHPSTIPQSQLDGSNYFRKYEFLQG